jgi:hypothetical protein
MIISEGLEKMFKKIMPPELVVREGVGAEGRNDPSLVCTYE